ncbi:hypothetical protein ACHWQZ_G012468 [Mnemiopsis leidyi]
MIEGVGLLPYSERLRVLELTTLAERRSRGDLIEVYKASHGLSQLAGVFNFSRKKSQKVPTFKANFKFISAILNYVLTHSPLDWNGLDFGNTIEADRKFRYTIEKIYLSFDKKVSNHRISLEERNNFLSENFDPSPFFTGYGPIFKKEKLESESAAPESQDDNFLALGGRSVQAEVSNPAQEGVDSSNCVVPLARHLRSDEPALAHDRKFPDSNGRDACSKHHIAIGSKRKRVPSSQRVVLRRIPINRNKMTVWRSTYRYKISQIENLKSEIRELKVQSSNTNKEAIDAAVSAATCDSVDRIRNLEETILEYETELSKKDEKIAGLKSKYKNLKDDYDAETFKHFEEIEDLRNKTEIKETDEILETFGNAFNIKEMPQMKMRFGPKNINNEILKILVILRLGLGLSLRKCVMCLVLVGNHTFGQKWKLPKNKEYSQNARANRCMPAPQESNVEHEAAEEAKGKSERYKNIDDYTAPAPSYLKKMIETIIEPNALGSTFEELKDSNTQYSTVSADHFTEHRQKHQTQNLMTSKVDPETGKSSVSYRCLGLNNAFKTTGKATFEHMKRIFQLGAILTAESDDAEDILNSLKEILAKVKFSVTDGASNMKGAIDNFSEWRTEMTGITNDFIWIHCNAHVLPALTGATEKCLKEVEKMLDLKMFVCQAFNKMFFKIAILPRMAEFKLSLLTKGHYGIVSFVVEELNTNTEINVDVVKGVLQMTCEEYLIAVVRQANEFYIREGSIIAQALEADEHALDNVPTTALAAERSVAQYRSSYKRAPNSNTRTHSNFQMITTSPFFPKFAGMNADQIAEIIRKTKKSDLNGILSKFNQRSRQIEQEALQGTVAELVKKRDVQAKTRAVLCQAVKALGGPIESPEEVDQFVNNFKGSQGELAKAIDTQLKFYKKIINDRTVNSDLFKCREKDMSAGGKYRIFSVEERIENLKKVVAPVPEEITFPQNINTDRFNQQIKDYQSSRSSYPHRVNELVDSDAFSDQTPVPCLPESNEPVTIPDSIEYIAAFYDGEQQPWYPGIVTKHIDSRSCDCCKALAGIEGLRSTCYMAKFMALVERDIYEISDDQEYHVHPSQLLSTPIVEYVQLNHGGLGYKVLNYLEIDKSVKENQLYKCLQDNLQGSSVPKSKGKAKASKRKRKSCKK